MTPGNFQLKTYYGLYACFKKHLHIKNTIYIHIPGLYIAFIMDTPMANKVIWNSIFTLWFQAHTSTQGSTYLWETIEKIFSKESD